MTLLQCLQTRYPHPEYLGIDLLTRIEELCRRHIALGLGDKNTEQRLMSADDAEYWQQLSEILLADQLIAAGLTVSHPKIGPDFLVMAGDCKVWVEVITPKPEGIDEKWLQRNSKDALSLPHEAVLLRWCAAIKEKAEKLLGNETKGVKGYLQKGIVSPSDSYVIAVNGYLLRHPPFPQLIGISQFPFVVEATFCVGPIQVFIDRETLQTVGKEHQQRVVIPKPNGAQVPADTFLDPRFSAISAIWGVDIDENLLLDRPCPMTVVHNPIALSSVPFMLLPSQTEYAAEVQNDSYLLTRRAGRLPDVGVLA